MNVYDELEQRGFIYQCTDPDGLRELLAKEQVTYYIGFDPTGGSLHVGSLVPIMAMVHMQGAGHRTIALMGGGTAMVGDPSGKNEMRRMISREVIDRNAVGIKAQFEQYLDFGEGRAVLLNNLDWLLPLNYIEFLRTIGRHMSVNRMMARESARLRYESADGLSLLEFNYACLQAYDFYVLARDHGCALQMGGRDQWGNICEGIDLIGRQDLGGRKAYGLTLPLLVGPGGDKFGKTVKGSVWLDAKLTQPFDFYQFWRNTEDTEVERYLKLFTLLPLDEIRRLGALKPPMINRAKEILAFEITMLAHGFETAGDVFAGAINEFGSADPEGTVETSSRIGEVAVSATGEGAVPTFDLEKGETGQGLAVIDLLVKAGMCRSKGEARRFIQGGGVYLNNARVAAADAEVTLDDFKDGTAFLKIGKKTVKKIRLK
ncbi:MAG: tyrosine--tRNA ligase [Pseudomonadota bacterium]